MSDAIRPLQRPRKDKAASPDEVHAFVRIEFAGNLFDFTEKLRPVLENLPATISPNLGKALSAALDELISNAGGLAGAATECELHDFYHRTGHAMTSIEGLLLVMGHRVKGKANERLHAHHDRIVRLHDALLETERMFMGEEEEVEPEAEEKPS